MASTKDVTVHTNGEAAPTPVTQSTFTAGIVVVMILSCATLGATVKVGADVFSVSEDVEMLTTKSDAILGTVYGGGRKASGDDTNPCHAAKPTAAMFDNYDCVTDAVEQAGGTVDIGFTGGRDTVAVPITTPYFQAGLCPVNVHWHLGTEHMSTGEYDDAGSGPSDAGGHRRLSLRSAPETPNTTPSGRRLAGDVRKGGQCHYYDASNPIYTTEYNWQHCVGMHVGETYEVHWPHSNMGACGTPNQFQTPFYDGVFCKLDETTAGSVGSTATGDVAIDLAPGALEKQIGVQGQIFTIVNDEDYYYPDLMRGMIVDGDIGTEITAYTGSTTGTTRSNTQCSAWAPITWHVDRKCHKISASSFDKMCADMKSQRDDMSGDFYAHGAREYVSAEYNANNQQNIKAAYTA